MHLQECMRVIHVSFTFPFHLSIPRMTTAYSDWLYQGFGHHKLFLLVLFVLGGTAIQDDVLHSLGRGCPVGVEICGLGRSRPIILYLISFSKARFGTLQ